MVAWGLAGLLVAGGLSVGAFALAGNDLGDTTQVSIHTKAEHAVLDDESASPVQATTTHSPDTDGKPTESPTPEDHHSSPDSGAGDNDREGDD